MLFNCHCLSVYLRILFLVCRPNGKTLREGAWARANVYHGCLFFECGILGDYEYLWFVECPCFNLIGQWLLCCAFQIRFRIETEYLAFTCVSAQSVYMFVRLVCCTLVSVRICMLVRVTDKKEYQQYFAIPYGVLYKSDPHTLHSLAGSGKKTRKEGLM